MVYDYELPDIVEEAEKRGYNKAIDDFSYLLRKAFDETNVKEYGFYPNNLVKEIVEQLKARWKA